MSATWSHLLWVALGGGLGAACRYGVTQMWLKPTSVNGFPIGTLAVNVVGSLLIGMIMTIYWDDALILLFAVTGFLGSLTTFSAIQLDSLLIAQRKKWFLFALYLALTYSLGLLAVLLGFMIGEWWR